MAGGRPREYDLVKLGEELVEWSKLPTSLNLIGFSSPRGFSVTRLPNWAEENKEFSYELSMAKENISQNRFQASCEKRMPESFFTRVEGFYDPLHHRHHRDEKKFDAELAASTNNPDTNITITHKDATSRNPS